MAGRPLAVGAAGGLTGVVLQALLEVARRGSGPGLEELVPRNHISEWDSFEPSSSLSDIHVPSLIAGILIGLSIGPLAELVLELRALWSYWLRRQLRSLLGLPANRQLYRELSLKLLVADLSARVRTLELELEQLKEFEVVSEVASGSCAPATSTIEPVFPALTDREKILVGVGTWVKERVQGLGRGLSGREQLPEQSRIYLLFKDFEGKIYNPAGLFVRWRDLEPLVKRRQDSVAFYGYSMSEPAEEGVDGDPWPSSAREAVLYTGSGDTTYDYPIGCLTVEQEGDQTILVQIIFISEVQNRLLVAFPLSAWHRQPSRRKLAPGTLIKGVALAVTGSSPALRQEASDGSSVKIWVGYLKPELEDRVTFETPAESDVLLRFEQDGGGEACLPFADALVVVADEKFSFCSAVSQESASEERLRKLEDGMALIQASLKQLVAKPTPAAVPSATLPKEPSIPKEAAPSGLDLRGLDPGVVQSARLAGIPETHLSQMATLVRKKSPALGDHPRKSPLEDVLGEELELEDAEDQDEPGSAKEPGGSMEKALIKLTDIVGLLSKSKTKKATLEELLDETGGIGDVSSSSSGSRKHSAILKALRKALVENPEQIYQSIRANMLEDFHSRVGGPGEAEGAGSFRGWLEHRSRIPNIQGSVRMAWAAGGALDALEAGKVAEAKARLALMIAQIDQVAHDHGQWLIAHEASLEATAPPFSSFGRHLLPAPNESQFTKLLDARWIEAFVQKVKEVEEYTERRNRLAGREDHEPALHAKAPGASASTVEASSWWNSFLRIALKGGTKFSIFLRTLLKVATPASVEEATGKPWPMPVPYPAVWFREAGGHELEDFSFKRAVNMMVASLNWLFLRRPPVAPACIRLGTKLSKMQWRAVRELERLSFSWKSKTVRAVDMGRTASKIEALEQAVFFLTGLSTESESSDLVFESSSSSHPGRGYGKAPAFRDLRAGLRHAFGGDVVGQTSGSGQLMAAKAIVADRLKFRGAPSFDPTPYLDRTGEAIFNRPLDMAMPPGTGGDPPKVKVHASRGERDRLLHLLDASNRLGFVGNSEVLQGYQAGLFAVTKDLSSDRLIFDSRPFNTLENPPGRWIASTATAASLLDIQLPAGHVLVSSGTDLRDFYYSFVCSDQRKIRNALVGPLSLAEASKFRSFRAADFREETHVYASLATLAMGDTCAVEIAQTAHVALLVQSGLLREENLLAMNLCCPRQPSMLGVVIDDLVALEIVAKQTFESGTSLEGGRTIESMVERYVAAGLTPHEKKTFKDQLHGEFWGASVDGEAGLVRANLCRALPIFAITAAVVKMGVTSLALLEILVGSWTSIFLFRRRLLSLFSVVYEPLQRGLRRKDVVKLSDEMRDELQMIVSLGPLAATDLRSENSPFVYCSDASEWGIGITKTMLPAGLEAEVHRHRLRKPVWTKLLTPLRRLQRLKGVLPAAEELPGNQQLPGHPLWLVLAGGLKYTEVYRKKVCRDTHINILELRGLVKTEEIAAREGFRRRVFSLADSQVALGAWTKGRAASRSLNGELQQSLATHLGCNMQSNAGYIPSEFNSSDGPSRNSDVPAPFLDRPSWFATLPDLSDFDTWLRSYEADPYSISGLPPLSELWAEAGPPPRKRFLRKAPRPRVAFSVECESESGRGPKDPESIHNSQGGGPKDPAVSNSQGRGPKNPESHMNQPGTRTQEPGKKQNSQGGGPKNPSKKQNSQGGGPKNPSKKHNSQGGGPKNPSKKRNSQGRPCIHWATVASTAMAMLANFSPEQFVWNPQLGSLPDVLQQYPGFLDLYSGKRGIPCAMAQSGPCWVLCFDNRYDPAQDLLQPALQEQILFLLESGVFRGFGAGMVCGSFSRAIRPSWRNAEHPEGKPNLGAEAQRRVAAGNQHSLFLGRILAVATRLRLCYWIEGPYDSFLWRMPDLAIYQPSDPANCFRLDYCRLRTPWRKRTRFFTNLHLAGFSLFCNRDHQHKVLTGYSKSSRCCWTLAAQEYPRRLCWWVAQAMLIDSRCVQRRPFSAASLARQSHGRIGEAKNPGPARGRDLSYRSGMSLDEVLLVEPATAQLGQRVHTAFLEWVSGRLSGDAAQALLQCPETLAELVRLFGVHMFDTLQSLYMFKQLITYLQRERPSLRAHFGRAWQTVSRWELCEPAVHRTPLPFGIFQAMIALSLAWNWRRWAACTALAFFGMCRPGEALKASREDVLLPIDLLGECIDSVFLTIRSPKTRRRGGGRVQHAKVQDPDGVRLCQAVFGSLPMRQPLYPGSPASYRRRWDALLRVLKIPARVHLTPASLRAGGVVREYRRAVDISNLLWRMRLRSVSTLERYLQEVGADSVYVQLSPEARQSVRAASALYEPTLRSL
ncbi:BSPAL1 [Symbiodinium sp. CCMP2592]|nr:BSPAL1 [Symbiodinium sp. CCMP2592]